MWRKPKTEKSIIKETLFQEYQNDPNYTGPKSIDDIPSNFIPGDAVLFGYMVVQKLGYWDKLRSLSYTKEAWNPYDGLDVESREYGIFREIVGHPAIKGLTQGGNIWLWAKLLSIAKVGWREHCEAVKKCTPGLG